MTILASSNKKTEKNIILKSALNKHIASSLPQDVHTHSLSFYGCPPTCPRDPTPTAAPGMPHPHGILGSTGWVQQAARAGGRGDAGRRKGRQHVAQ